MIKNNRDIEPRQQQAVSIAQAEAELIQANACDNWILAQIEEVNRHG